LFKNFRAEKSVFSATITTLATDKLPQLRV
jgi:hypothetical protein